MTRVTVYFLKTTFWIVGFVLSVLSMTAQGVGVNESGTPPHSGAILDVESQTKGLLLPRTQASLITNPTEGMVIYDTDADGFRYYNGVQWVMLLEEGDYSFWWADQDGDGFGYAFNVIYAPDPPQYYVGNNQDCNDLDEQIHPDAIELCDGIDNNCDGVIDEGNPGGGSICGSSIGACTQGVLTCVDGVLQCIGEVAPMDEICDGIDNNCDGQIDESPVDGIEFWPDVDNDNFGDYSANSIVACTQPPGFADNNLDCNDQNLQINPLANEVCDGIDNNCDGVIDECPGSGTCCGGICVDTTSDPNHCGGCDLPCNDGNPCTIDICVSGTCMFENAPSGTPCPDGSCDGNGNCIPE